MLMTGVMSASAAEPDVMPGKAKIEKASTPIPQVELSKSMLEDDMSVSELTLENLYAALDKYGVKYPKIVAAQALLETGYFTSDLCLNSHNLFGLRHPSDGSYYTFDNWEESVKAYRDDVQYKYSDGDYYRFLDRIGYAQDRHYTSKVRRIAAKL